MTMATHMAPAIITQSVHWPVMYSTSPMVCTVRPTRMIESSTQLNQMMKQGLIEYTLNPKINNEKILIEILII